VNLRDPETAKAKTVGKLRLFEKFVQASFRRRAVRALDFCKEAEFQTATRKLKIDSIHDDVPSAQDNFELIKN